MVEPTYRLPCYRRFAYGIGHVLNDLCASIWFSYLLVYYHSVLRFSNQDAGILLLIGQIADAIATPLVGYESDRIQGCCGYTKRKSWHLLGTICVMFTFPFLFMPIYGVGVGQPDDWARFIYYAPFIVIFQFGWASTQISHLSLIPELTPNTNERVELNAIRYAFTVCSNIAVYVTAWLLLNAADGDSTSIGPMDIATFRTLVISVVSAGTIFAIAFHIFTKERREEDSPRGILARLTSIEKMNWNDWLKEPQFYMVAVLYMCTRLIVNVSQIYLPMYLTESLNLHKQYIATVPLAVFISGFLISFLMRPLNRIAGRKITYLIGLIIVLGSLTWMFLLDNCTDMEVFGAAILLGAGTSTILVTSLSMTADLIGDRTESGAFVYGAMSFTDKLSNGIAVVIIQHLHPCKAEACCAACVWFYRDMIVFVPGGVAILALITLIIIAPQQMGTLRKSVGDQFRRESECLESSPLMGGQSHSLSSSDGEMSCCSYLCCVSLSRDAQDHKVALCSTCGLEDCRKHRLVNGDSNYQSFQDSGYTNQDSLASVLRNGHSSMSDEDAAAAAAASASRDSVKTCVANAAAAGREYTTCKERSATAADAAASGSELKTCSNVSPSTPSELKTCADVHPMNGNAGEPKDELQTAVISPSSNTTELMTCAAGKPITVSADVHT